jgi:phage shock protein PspC (stress-responsive transcriptional regulator)
MVRTRERPYGQTMTEPPSAPSVTEPAEPGPGPLRQRLRRSRRRRIVAGVASGVADRFDIDVSVVRIIFVMLALLWGLGVALYLAMWAFVPRATDEEDAGPDEGSVSTSPWLIGVLAVGAAIVAVVFLTTWGGVPQVARGLVWAWVAFLVMLAVLSLRRGERRFTLGRLVTIFLLVVISIVLILTGALLAFLASTGVPLTGGNGVRTWQPTSFADVTHDYRVEFGSSTLNLGAVEFPTAGYDVTASVGIGTLNVILPEDVVVDLRTRVGLGSISETNESTYASVTTPLNPDPASKLPIAQLPHVTLDVSVGVGQINVWRSAP